MGPHQPPPVQGPMWAHSYALAPTLARESIRSIKVLLDRAHADAARADRRLSGRFVVEQRVSHILVVSDSPELDETLHLELISELTRLGAGFTVTLPMIVSPPDGDTLPLQEPAADPREH
jgi:hypothetical protein